MQVTKQEFINKTMPTITNSAEWDLIVQDKVKIDNKIYSVKVVDLENIVILEEV